MATGTTSRFIKVNDSKYYVSKDGTAHTGWQVVNNVLYYGEPSTGILWKNKTYEGIVFDSDCKAANNTSAQLKMKTMQIVASITKSSMSQAQKLSACWNYVVLGAGFSYASVYPNLNQKGWQKQEALNMFNRRYGNCYGFACAFAALAGEIGYEPYVICGRITGTRDGAADGLTRHAWVRIDGKYYDPEAQFKGWWTGVYGLPSYDINHQVQYTVNFRTSI